MWWLFACGLPTTASPPPAAPPPEPVGLEAARFLEGCWTARPTSLDTTECWKLKPGYLNGVLTDARPDATPSLQLMRLTGTPTGLELHVHAVGSPPGGAPVEPVVLPLAEATDRHLVFRRTGDGFPTEARHTLSDDTLTVHFRGRLTGRPVARTYALMRDSTTP